MPAYAVAVIRETRFGSEVREYLERIDATLAPHQGRFRIHGGPYRVLEGDWSGDLVVIEFPTHAQALAWYESHAYRAIRPLREDNTEGTVFLVDGVPGTHRTTDILSPS
jgi:uncharacterized protein (DUF1330 family)